MTTNSQPLRRLAAAGVLVLGLGLGASACGPTNLGAAAVVDGQRITVSEVQGALEEVRTLREQLGVPAQLDSDEARLEVNRRILDLVFERAAAELGIVVTDGAVAQTRAAEGLNDAETAELAAQIGVSVERLDTVYRTDALQRAIQRWVRKKNPDASDAELTQKLNERLIQTAQAMEIRLNPRYGSFDPTTGQIGPKRFDFFRTGT